MGFFEYYNIGVSAPTAVQNRVKEVMYCLFPGGETGGSENSILDHFVPDIIRSMEDSLVTAEELYLLMKKLFGTVFIYQEFGEGNSISDAYTHSETLYDPKAKKVWYAQYAYCYGERMVNNHPAFYYINQNTLREKLENAGIRETLKNAMFAQDWVLDEEFDDVWALMDALMECDDLKYGWYAEDAELYLGEILPDAADVIDQVVSIIDELESDLDLQALATKIWNSNLPHGEVKPSIVEKLRQIAEQKEYQELLALIQKKFG